MIKAIIFDFGGVLAKDVDFHDFGDEFAKNLDKNADQFKKLIRDTWDQAKINQINSQLFWQKMADFLEVKPKLIRDYFVKYAQMRSGVYQEIQRLKKAGYKLGLLSNHIEDWLEEIIQNHHLQDLFDVIVTSYGSRKAKPDTAIYQEILKKLKVAPQQCLYIDDQAKNLPPARLLGMRVIQYKNFRNLKKQISLLISQ